jgi:alkylation response protein AidB-like acyl-CoA dehydrogenase
VNLELTEEQVALVDTVRRFLAEKAPIAGHVRPMLTEPTGMTESTWRGLADIGAVGLLVPAEQGGAGMSMVEAALVSEELGAALHPGPWLSSAVAAPRLLLRFGVTDQDELSTGLADGTVVATVAPLGTGAEGLSVERDGDATVLRGALDDVADAAAADVLLVLADTGGKTAVLAVPNSPDVVQHGLTKGIDQSRKRFRVLFDGAPCRVIAEADDAAVEALVDDVLIASAADALGAASRLLAMTVDYAKVRQQFGKAIGSFQAVAHLCADMYETVELARCAVMYASWAAGEAEDGERHLAALRVKAFAGRLASVGDQAIQVFGGIGYTWEHDAHLYLKRLLSFSALMGSPDTYLQRVGLELAGRPR